MQGPVIKTKACPAPLATTVYTTPAIFFQTLPATPPTLKTENTSRAHLGKFSEGRVFESLSLLHAIYEYCLTIVEGLFRRLFLESFFTHGIPRP